MQKGSTAAASCYLSADPSSWSLSVPALVAQCRYHASCRAQQPLCRQMAADEREEKGEVPADQEISTLLDAKAKRSLLHKSDQNEETALLLDASATRSLDTELLQDPSQGWPQWRVRAQTHVCMHILTHLTHRCVHQQQYLRHACVQAAVATECVIQLKMGVPLAVTMCAGVLVAAVYRRPLRWPSHGKLWQGTLPT